MATHWGITGWEPGAAVTAAGTCFRAWLDARGGESNQEEAAMLSQVREFLARHGEARFADWNRPVSKDDHAPRVMNKAGFRKQDEARLALEYFIYPEVFRSEVCRGHDHRAVARLLQNHGFIQSSEKSRIDGKESLPGEGRKRVIHVLPSLWEDENVAGQP